MHDAMPAECQIEYTTALAVVVVTLGGWAAEYIIFNEHSRNAKNDTDQVIEILRQIEPDEEKMATLMHRCMNLCLKLLSDHGQLRQLADALNERGVMSRAEIDELLGPVSVWTVDWDKIWQPSD